MLTAAASPEEGHRDDAMPSPEGLGEATRPDRPATRGEGRGKKAQKDGMKKREWNGGQGSSSAPGLA